MRLVVGRLATTPLGRRHVGRRSLSHQTLKNPDQFGRGALRLQNAGIGTCLDGSSCQTLHVGVGEDNDRCGLQVNIGADELQHLEPMQLGQHQVQDDRIRPDLGQQLDRRQAVHRRFNSKALALQSAPVHRQYERVVLNE